jgi:hypothetical protein
LGGSVRRNSFADCKKMFAEICGGEYWIIQITANKYVTIKSIVRLSF